MRPSFTYCSNWARLGAGSVPLKPPMDITGSPDASWYPAASFDPTAAAAQVYLLALAFRAAVSAAFEVLPLSRPPIPPPPPVGPPANPADAVPVGRLPPNAPPGPPPGAPANPPPGPPPG